MQAASFTSAPIAKALAEKKIKNWPGHEGRSAPYQ
jgi:hypothetical protein